VKKDT